MLSTEVELVFPKASRAGRWTPLSNLYPVLETGNITSGEVVASGLTVENMKQFKALEDKLNGKTNASNLTEPKSLLCAEIGPSKFYASMFVQVRHIALFGDRKEGRLICDRLTRTVDPTNTRF